MFRLIVRHSYVKVINKAGNLQRSTEERSKNHCSIGKSMSITYSDSVFVASAMQQAMSMCHIFICGLSGCTIFSSHYLANGKIFSRKLLPIKCVFWFPPKDLFETFVILRTEADRIKNVYQTSRKVQAN